MKKIVIMLSFLISLAIIYKYSNRKSEVLLAKKIEMASQSLEDSVVVSYIDCYGNKLHEDIIINAVEYETEALDFEGYMLVEVLGEEFGYAYNQAEVIYIYEPL